LRVDEAAFFDVRDRLVAAGASHGVVTALGPYQSVPFRDPDGLEGTERRMDTARQFVSDYTVGTECGFGRRAPETIPSLLRLHLDAADYA
jgi:hypothetical protein